MGVVLRSQLRESKECFSKSTWDITHSDSSSAKELREIQRKNVLPDHSSFNLSFSIHFFLYKMYLFIWKSEFQTKLELFHLQFHSSNGYKSFDWARSKPGAISHMVTQPQAFGPPSAASFFRPLAGSWIRNRAARNRAGFPGGSFNHYAITQHLN